MGFICNQCPRECGAYRGETGNGVCGMGEDAYLARAALHFDEEPVISGKNGSGTIFFSGCPLKCVFCQNYQVSHEKLGAKVTKRRLREICEELIAQGANNINFVTPTHYAHLIREVLVPKLPVPVIYNTSGYEKVETVDSLNGLIDVYLPDLKYTMTEPAGRYSKAPDYFEVASAALKRMYEQVGPVRLNENGIIEKGMIVRHLMLPGQLENTYRALDFIREELPGAWVSLMAQYVPMGRAEDYPEINVRLTAEEYESAVHYMNFIGLEDGFTQALSSSDERYTPPFDLQGVEKQA